MTATGTGTAIHYMPAQIVAGGYAPWVAVGADGEIKGFAGGGAARDDDVTGAGEVFAIYLLAEHWGPASGAG